MIDLATGGVRTAATPKPTSLLFSSDDRMLITVGGTFNDPIAFLRVTSGGAIRIRVKGGPVRELGGQQPCGPDRGLAMGEHSALLRTGDTTALCELSGPPESPWSAIIVPVQPSGPT